MHMSTLTRRLQVLLDEERYVRLERAAERRGISVAAVVREAIDRMFGGEEIDRQAAGEKLLSAEPMEVEGWRETKRHLADEMAGLGGGERSPEDAEAALL